MSTTAPKSAKPYWIITAAVIILLAACTLFYHQQLTKTAAQTQAAQEAARLDYDTALINACLPQVQEAIDSFYADYLSTSPTAANYVTTVESVATDENHNNATVVLTVYPYVGPHDSVGTDRITLALSNTGNITVQTFEHLNNCALPDNLSDLILQPLPKGQEEQE